MAMNCRAQQHGAKECHSSTPPPPHARGCTFMATNWPVNLRRPLYTRPNEPTPASPHTISADTCTILRSWWRTNALQDVVLVHRVASTRCVKRGKRGAATTSGSWRPSRCLYVKGNAAQNHCTVDGLSATAPEHAANTMHHPRRNTHCSITSSHTACLGADDPLQGWPVIDLQ